MIATGTRTTLFGLTDLLDRVHEGHLALPDFQRSFNWEPSNVRALLATVLRGWPAGSLMFVEGAPEFGGRPRPFEGAPPLSDSLAYLVLAGQQRLTALYQALYGTGSKNYFLEVSIADPQELWLDVEQLEERIVWPEGDSPLPKPTPGSIHIPFTALRTPDEYVTWTTSAPSSPLSRLALTDLYRKVVSGMTAFQFPTVVLDVTVEAAAVARMFERVNATGLTLSAFDLVVARTFAAPSQPNPWNLRGAFEDAIDEDPLLEAFLVDDGLPLLEAISLKLNRNVRRRAVTRLSAVEVQQHWPSAVVAMRNVLALLVSEYGVLAPNWIPYDAQIVVLSAFAMDHGLPEHTDLVRAWFWSRAFGSAFEVGVNTSIVREYAALVSAAGGVPLPTIAGPTPDDLVTASRAAGSQLYRAFLCAMVVEDPVDLATLEDPQGERRLEFGDAVVFPVVRSSPEIVKPSARVRALSQVAARQRPPWLRGDASVRHLGEHLVGRDMSPQFLPDADALLAANLSTEALWATRAHHLFEFLDRAAGGVLVLPALRIEPADG